MADKQERPYGRHPAQVTNDRLLDAYERWFGKLSGEERDAIGIVRNALWRIVAEADAEAAAARELKPCGTEAAYRRHLRNGEPTDEACRAAHAEGQRTERKGCPCQ
jgi:hypothetical protein